MRALLTLLIVVPLAMLGTACGGPEDGALKASQERQAQESEAAEGESTSSESTKEDDSTGTATTGSESTKTPAKAHGDKDGDDASGLDAAARDLFAQSCGGCHTLSDANASGQAGPNLDETAFDRDQVLAQIKNGGGAMPGGLLQGDDAEQVADYVAAAAAATK